MSTEEIMAQMWERLQSLSPEEKKVWRENLEKRLAEIEKDEEEEEQQKQVKGKNDNNENQG